jgi:hypothetical protein
MVFDESGRSHLPTKVLVASLIALEESPWGDLKGRQLDERGLASRLRKYEVKPKTLRLDAVTTIKGYEVTDFYDAWARYLAPPPKDDSSVTSVTSVTDEPRRPPPVTAVTDVTLKRPMGGDGQFLPSFPAAEAEPPSGHVCEYCRKEPDGTEQRVAYGGLDLWLHPNCQRTILGEDWKAPTADENRGKPI